LDFLNQIDLESSGRKNKIVVKQILEAHHSQFTSNRCQFYQRKTREFFVRMSFLNVCVTRKKLPKRHLYEKFVRRMLMKLTTGVNTTNILQAAIWYKCVF